MGDPTGTAGDVNTVQIDGYTFQNHVIGTQTILAPKRVATGLDITQDLTANDGMEYTLGCEDPANTVISALSPGTFKVGTDKAFYFAMKLNNLDVDGLDELMVGWRKSEAYQATIETDYDEMAAFNVMSGDIFIDTILNAGSNTSTDTTVNWTDDTTKTLTVWCDSLGDQLGTARAVYYEIDGVKPTTVPTALFKFDADEVVIPFIAFRHDTNVGEVICKLWESGEVGGFGEMSHRAGQ